MGGNPSTSIEQELHPIQIAIGRPILDVSLRGKRSRQGWDSGILRQLRVDLEAGVMVMVMAVVYYYHNLRLRRIGYCETEDEHETEHNSFHNPVSRSPNLNTELL
jgi:hypothetical protein